MIEPSKENIKSKKKNEGIPSVQNLVNKIFNPSMNNPNKNYYYFERYCPSPIESMTYIQLLKEYSEKFPNLVEIKFSLFEADDDIVKIAKKENG